MKKIFGMLALFAVLATFEASGRGSPDFDQNVSSFNVEQEVLGQNAEVITLEFQAVADQVTYQAIEQTTNEASIRPPGAEGIVSFYTYKTDASTNLQTREPIKRPASKWRVDRSRYFSCSSLRA